MRYIDIISEFYDFSEYLKLSPNCLAWAAHHERAVFNIGDDVHDKTAIVWFQLAKDNRETQQWDFFVEKVKLVDGNWIVLSDERGNGFIPTINDNPFCPYQKYTGKHYATCVFPQNLQKHPDGRCYKKLIGVNL